MTTDASKMEAGAALDAMVAERVMGWKRGDTDTMRNRWLSASGAGYHCLLTGYTTYNFQPSRDIAAAWLVVGVMIERDRFCSLFYSGSSPEERWGVKFRDGISEHRVYAPTAPIALSRAALLALPTPGTSTC